MEGERQRREAFSQFLRPLVVNLDYSSPHLMVQA